MAFGEQREHLLDLDDLLCRAAEKAEERFAEGLAQDSKPAEIREAAREMWIAAPGQRVGQRGEIAVGAEICGEGGGGLRRIYERRAPLGLIAGAEAQTS